MKLFLNAGDSVLLVAHTNKKVVENTFSKDLQNVNTWLSDERLSHAHK